MSLPNGRFSTCCEFSLTVTRHVLAKIKAISELHDCLGTAYKRGFQVESLKIISKRLFQAVSSQSSSWLWFLIYDNMSFNCSWKVTKFGNPGSSKNIIKKSRRSIRRVGGIWTCIHRTQDLRYKGWRNMNLYIKNPRFKI